MSQDRTSTERLAMLLACGSPGSAMSYHGLMPRFEAHLVQCNAVESTGTPVPTAPPADRSAVSCRDLGRQADPTLP